MFLAVTKQLVIDRPAIEHRDGINEPRSEVRGRALACRQECAQVIEASRNLARCVLIGLGSIRVFDILSEDRDRL